MNLKTADKTLKKPFVLGLSKHGRFFLRSII